MVFGDMTEEKQNKLKNEICKMTEEKQQPIYSVARYIANKYAVAVSTFYSGGKTVFKCQSFM